MPGDGAQANFNCDIVVDKSCSPFDFDLNRNSIRIATDERNYVNGKGECQKHDISPKTKKMER